MALLIGKFIDEFEVLSVIGTGGFSTVYLARNAAGFEVAIKVLAENHAYDPDVRERFISEADALSKVRSDLIVEVFGLGETSDGQPYIILQHADRGDLVQRRRALISNGWKPLAIDVQFLVDVIADALESVHVKDLVHRDVSPSNILIHSVKRNLNREGIPFLRTDESLLLADFGLVKDMAQGSGLTVGAGTPGFSAPEQRNGLALIDHRIDIYAASAVVLWFLTGATAPTMPDWRDRLTEQNLPAFLLDAIERGLSTLPEDRHQSIDEWHTDISDNLTYLDKFVGEAAPEPEAQLAPVKVESNSVLESVWPVLSSPVARLIFWSSAVVAVVVLAIVSLTRSPENAEVTPSESTTTEISEVDAAANPATTLSTQITQPESTTSPSIETTQAFPDNVRPPELGDAYFEFSNGQPVLIVVWSTNEPPPGVVGREVQIAVNGGSFEREFVTKTIEDLGWEIASTGISDEIISRANTYDIRTRWVSGSNETSEWSPIRTVRATETETDTETDTETEPDTETGTETDVDN